VNKPQAHEAFVAVTVGKSPGPPRGDLKAGAALVLCPELYDLRRYKPLACSCEHIHWI
jgi:hypothetical protein